MRKNWFVFSLFMLIVMVTFCYAKEEPKSISYKAFLPFLPEKIGNLAPTGDPDGKTSKMGGMSITEVSQSYADPANAENKGSCRISYNSMLAGAGAFGMMIPEMEEESTAGYKKNITIQDYKALIEYETKGKYARVSLTVGPIMVEADALGVESEEPLVNVIDAMDLKALEKTAE